MGRLLSDLGLIKRGKTFERENIPIAKERNGLWKVGS